MTLASYMKLTTIGQKPFSDVGEKPLDMEVFLQTHSQSDLHFTTCRSMHRSALSSATDMLSSAR